MVDQLKSLNTKMTFQQTAVQQVGSVADQLKLALTTALGENTGDGLMATVQNLFSQAPMRSTPSTAATTSSPAARPRPSRSPPPT